MFYSKFIFYPSFLGQSKSIIRNTPRMIYNLFQPVNYDFVKCHPTNNNKNLENLYYANKDLRRYHNHINIGGDHSMSIATIAASLHKNPNVKVLWVDAHPDINTYQSSDTKNIHGMPLSYLTGLDYSPNFEFLNDKNILLPFDNIMYLGIRDIDEFEKDIIQKHKIKNFNPYEFNNYFVPVLKEIDNFIGDEEVHLSFDVDALDPKYLNSTGTPVAKGLKYRKAKQLLDYLLIHKNIINMDITELNLDIGNEKKSIYTFMHLFHNYIYHPNNRC